MIIGRTSGTGELHPILLLGDYSTNMGVPRPKGVTENWQYAGHDGKIIQELGEKDASGTQSVDVDLMATYQEG